MPLQDKAEARSAPSLNGFLRRWRRNASHAGLVAVVLAVLVAAVVVFAVCACQNFPSSAPH